MEVKVKESPEVADVFSQDLGLEPQAFATLNK